jgi:UDP-N-acetylmuramoylalanine--D-glutamate ligase
MTVQERITGRRIGIIGMARSGVAAARLAQRLGGRPFVSDSAPGAKLLEACHRLDADSIPYETGSHSGRLLEVDYLVVSPGVAPSIRILEQARQAGLPVFSEIEFASWLCKGRIIAITGSNGKTTTTTMVGEIFAAAGIPTFTCGNIGDPFSDVADRVPDDGVAVVEVSSYQLEGIEDFRPHVAAILNISPDHLDRHGSLAAYAGAKFRITENQRVDDHLILNRDDAGTREFDIQSRADVSYFTTTDEATALAFVAAGELQGRSGEDTRRIIAVDRIKIPGPHNLQNASAAAAIALTQGIEPAVIAGVLESFPGVEHRLEEAGRVAGVRFVNDSKATNVEAVCYALQSIAEPLYLILGGRDKGSSYRPIIETGKKKLKGVFAIGEAREKIFDELGQAVQVQFADTLEAAVTSAFEQADPGEAVLLSPGCASFDMFDNFEHRGRAFKQAVAGLKNGRKRNETVSQ